MQRVLVTGTNGFVGRSVIKALIAKGFIVRGAFRSQHSVLKSNDYPMETCIVGDINAATDWRDALKEVDYVVHLAARVHVMHDITVEPLNEFRQVNVSGTENLARAAAKANVRRLVFLSSIKVNGENSDLQPNQVFTEQDSAHPQEPYAQSKWEAEQILQQIANETALEVVILRPPLVYGPDVRANFLKLIRLVHTRIPVPFGSIHNKRSLIYVDNLADAICQVLTPIAAANQTYLVSDLETVSTTELMKSIAGVLGFSARLFVLPYSWLRLLSKLTGKSDVFDRLFNSLVIENKKIRSELNWTPPFTFKNGLKSTIDWYLKTLNP